MASKTGNSIPKPTEPPDESGPPIPLIVGCSVGGFFVFIILMCALKAMCSSRSEMKRIKKLKAERAAMRSKARTNISTIAVKKPVINYDGPTYNNIPVVRAGDDPNSIEIRRKGQRQQKNGQNLASLVHSGNNSDDRGYIQRRNVAEIGLRREIEMMQKMARRPDESFEPESRFGVARVHIEHERNGYPRIPNARQDQPNDIWRAQRPGQNGNGGLPLQTRKLGVIQEMKADSAHVGTEFGKSMQTKLRPEANRIEPKRARPETNLSQYKPAELPNDWLPPSKRTNKLRPLTPPKKDFLLPKKTARVSAADDVVPALNHGYRPEMDGNKKFESHQAAKQYCRESLDNRVSNGFHVAIPGPETITFNDFNNSNHKDSENGHPTASKPGVRRLPPTFKSPNGSDTTGERDPLPDIKKKKKRVIAM